MDFQKEARKDIEFILKETGLTQGEISVKAGYAEQSLTQMLSANNISGRMMKNIRREFEEVFKKSTMENQHQQKHELHYKGMEDKNEMNRDEKELNEIVNKDKEFYMDTINDLRKTGITLSETNKDATIIGKETAIANRILAENQQVLLESQKELISILKQMHKPTADAAKETQQDPAVQLQQYLEQIASGGVPAYWDSKEEGLKVLGRFLHENQAAK